MDALSAPRRAGPLAVIVAGHLVLAWLAYSGLLRRAVKVALPEPVFIRVLAPPTPPASPSVVSRHVTQLPAPAFAPEPALMLSSADNTVAVAAAPAVATPVPAPEPAGAAPPRLLSSGVEYLQAPAPVYPAISRRMGEQGKVVLRVLVNEQGLPNQVLVQSSSGFARLDEAARQAVLRALFKPHVEDGRAVAVYVLVPLNFLL